MDRKRIELAAIRTLRFCRKYKKDFRKFGYPPRFVAEIEALEAAYPDNPPGWIIQRGSLKDPELKKVFDDPGLIDKVLAYYV